VTAKKSRKTKVIVVINQKGGPGKTTVSFHLAHAGIKNPQSKVLCLDLDSQGNLSQYLTGDLDIAKQTDGGVSDLFEGLPLTPRATSHPQIELLHGHEDLDRVDSDTDAEERAYAPEMREKLRNLDYDLVVIDTPPAVGLRHLSPLTWADIAVIPVEPSVTNLAGLQNVVKQIQQSAIAQLNPDLRWVGLVNRANLRLKAQRAQNDWAFATYPKNMMATLASRGAVAEAVEESPARPVWKYSGAPRELREQWLDVCTKIINK
jgi:chromosome partitioning protein